MVLERNRMYQGSLILVNRRYPMRHTPNRRELCPVSVGQPEIRMECESAAMLKKLLEEVGYHDTEKSIVGVSGYRSEEEQIRIFEDSLEENGREFTEKFVAFPNHSEHQSGLAIDLAENRPEIDFICPDFPYEGICQEFREKMADFGFIERYPKEKQDVTGIGSEPWHFRYVGVPHARLMQEQGMVLEEYVEWLKQFDLLENPLSLHRENLPHKMADGITVGENMEIRIGYVRAQGDFTKIECIGEYGKRARIEYVGAQGDYMGIEGQLRPGIRISGNNVDGFIITCITEKHSLSLSERNRRI